MQLQRLFQDVQEDISLWGHVRLFSTPLHAAIARWFHGGQGLPYGRDWIVRLPDGSYLMHKPVLQRRKETPMRYARLLVSGVLCCGLVTLPVFAQDSYETQDGFIVNCNGYDPAGNWVPCPEQDSGGSYSDSLSDTYEAAKRKVQEVRDAFKFPSDNEEEWGGNGG